jgi:hypothetical protein
MSTTRFGACFCFVDHEGDSISIPLKHVTGVRVEEGISSSERPIEIRFLVGNDYIDIEVTREMAAHILNDLWLRGVPVPTDSEEPIEPKAWVTE